MWSAATACLRSGFSGADLDISGSLAIASAFGVDLKIAAELLKAFAEGMRVGQARKQSNGDDPGDGTGDAGS